MEAFFVNFSIFLKVWNLLGFKPSVHLVYSNTNNMPIWSTNWFANFFYCVRSIANQSSYFLLSKQAYWEKWSLHYVSGHWIRELKSFEK